MRQRVCWLVVAVLLLMCSSVSHAVQKVEVVTFDDLLTQWYNNEGAKFSKVHPDIVVEARVIPGFIAGITDHITVRIAAGDPPDMADNVLRIYYPWADGGLLLDMLPLLERSTVVRARDLIPGLVNAKLYKGKLYNAPTSIDPFLTDFDGQMFDEAGVVDPYTMSRRGEWSWDAGLRAAQKLVRRNADGAVTQWGWIPGHNTDWSWGSYILTNGGRILSEDLRRPAFTEEPAVEALSWIAELYQGYQVGTRGLSFLQTNVAMSTGNAGHLKQRWQAQQRAGLSAAPIAPRQAGTASHGYMFADGPIAFNKGRNVDSTWKFVEWLMTEDAQRSLALTTGRVPGRMDALKYWAELSAEYIGGKERAHLWSDAAGYAQLLPLGVHYNDVMAVINPAVAAILDGKEPARTALAKAAGQVQAVLDKHYGTAK